MSTYRKLIVGSVGLGATAAAAIWIFGRQQVVPHVSDIKAKSGQVTKSSTDRSIAPHFREGKPNAIPTICTDISSLRDSMTPALAANLLKRLKSEIADVGIRASLAGSVIENLCRSGYDEEAWRLIDSGFGIQRDLQLRVFFAASNCPDALQKIKSLTDINEKTRAIQGYVSRLAVAELATANLSMLVNEEALSGVLANNLAMRMTYPVLGPDSKPVDKRQNLAVVDAAMKIVRAGGMTATDFYNIVLSKDRSTDDFEKLAIIDELAVGKDDGPDKHLTAIMQQLVDNMVYRDAPRTMNSLIERQDAGAPLLETAIQSWLTIDNDGANAWQSERLESLTQSQKDYVAAGMVRHALKHGEAEAAGEWMRRIQSPQVRTLLTGLFK